MAESKLVGGLGSVDEMWGAALKESGLRFFQAQSSDELLQQAPDFLLIDLRAENRAQDLERIKENSKIPILSLIKNQPNRDDLLQLKNQGVSEYVVDNTPPEEIVLRIRSMMHPVSSSRTGESRSSKRVWFQQKVSFQIFEKDYSAWSTTLSETGIFLRTALSFPLYSVMRLNFKLWGDEADFACDGVIVRQEVEGDLKGLGVMFQNLKGENVRRLESFFELYRQP